MFLILVIMDGRLRYRVFKNTLCKTSRKGCELQKAGVTGSSLVCNFDSVHKYLV